MVATVISWNGTHGMSGAAFPGEEWTLREMGVEVGVFPTAAPKPRMYELFIPWTVLDCRARALSAQQKLSELDVRKSRERKLRTRIQARLHCSGSPNPRME